MQQKITPVLWFDNNAEDAMNLYTATFKNSRIVSMTRYGEAGPGPAGTIMSVTFELAGQTFMALNGGPQFPFTEAISLLVDCETQPEVDALWAKLTADGGEPQSCGWLKDRFGLSWQIIPRILNEMLGDADPAKAGRVMHAMLQMQKIDMAALERAYAQP